MNLLERIREAVRKKTHRELQETANSDCKAPSVSVEEIATPSPATASNPGMLQISATTIYRPHVVQLETPAPESLCVHVWQKIGDGADSQRCANCGLQPGLRVQPVKSGQRTAAYYAVRDSKPKDFERVTRRYSRG